MQRSSWCHDSNAGERSERIRARHSDRNSGSGAATVSTILPGRPARRGDRRVGVRHQLGDDLNEVDAALREVLPEVPPARASEPHRRTIQAPPPELIRGSVAQTRGQNVDATDDGSVRSGTYRPVTMSDPAQLRVSNQELATVREAMRELGRLLDQLDEGELEKVVLTQRNQMRAVLITVERYSELERGVA